MTEEEKIERQRMDAMEVANYIFANIRKHIKALSKEDYERCDELIKDRDLVFKYYSKKALLYSGNSYEQEYADLIGVYEDLLDEQFYVNFGKTRDEYFS